MEEPRTDHSLGCRPLHLKYDFKTRIGHLHLFSTDSPDMTGTIKMFKRVDRAVKMVHVSTELRGLDISYVLENNKWSAVDHTANAAMQRRG